MRVLFNQWSTVGQKTGIGHCAWQLLDQLRQSPDVSVQGFPSDRWIARRQWMRSLWLRLRSYKGRRSGLAWAFPFPVKSLLRWGARRIREFEKRRLERIHHEMLFSDAFDLYHEPNFIPLASSLKTVTTLHDLSVLLHPEWHPASRVHWYEQGFPTTLEQTTHFITVSDFTRRQVLRHLGVPAHRVTCVHNAARPEFQPMDRRTVTETLHRHELPGRYLLYVGTIEPRKNILRLMKAYCSLPQPVRMSCPLLLVGQWGWNVADEHRFYRDEARHRGVRQFGYLADELMPALYNGARALVYPSHYEGFGLPPLEMLACGGAVLASNIEAISEVVGDQGHLISPENMDGWRESMLRVIVDDDWWQELRQGAQQAAQYFSWRRCAEETMEVYRRAVTQEDDIIQIAPKQKGAQTLRRSA